MFEMFHCHYAENAEPPSKKPPKWKNCCATILSDGNGVFFSVCIEQTT